MRLSSYNIYMYSMYVCVKYVHVNEYYLRVCVCVWVADKSICRMHVQYICHMYFIHVHVCFMCDIVVHVQYVCVWLIWPCMQIAYIDIHTRVTCTCMCMDMYHVHVYVTWNIHTLNVYECALPCTVMNIISILILNSEHQLVIFANSKANVRKFQLTSASWEYNSTHFRFKCYTQLFIVFTDCMGCRWYIRGHCTNKHTTILRT